MRVFLAISMLAGSLAGSFAAYAAESIPAIQPPARLPVTSITRTYTDQGSPSAHVHGTFYDESPNNHVTTHDLVVKPNF